MAKDDRTHLPRRKDKPPRPESTFVRRSTYRQRRLRDASRLLPFAGLALLFLPFYAPVAPGPSAQLTYFLVVWAGLVVVAFLLSRSFERDRGAGQ